MGLTFSLLSINCHRKTTERWLGRVETDLEKLQQRLVLETKVEANGQGRISQGTFAVYENRNAQTGKMIHLKVVVLHALSPHPRPDPIFFLAGGPGADVTANAPNLRRSPFRRERDIVLVSQRGTGGDNRLDCPEAANDEDLQSYLGPFFREAVYQKCLKRLSAKYDLRWYSTFAAADDLYEVRLALGYDQINLIGGSYGTRMALIYMSQHPETVRTAILNGVVPVAFRNPLYHSPAAARALELILNECVQVPECQQAFPHLREELESIFNRLEKEPVIVEIDHPVTKKKIKVSLDKAAFAEALRTIMYSDLTNRQVPYLIHQAYLGDFQPFATQGLASNRRIRKLIALGMLLCVTCAEDVARINPEEIPAVIGNSFLGDRRVKQQMAVCRFWPKSILPDDFAKDVSVDVPTLIISGNFDPVTPPRWGEEAARHLPQSLHLVIPGAHVSGGKCLEKIQQQFLDTWTVVNLDTACAQQLPKTIKFYIPQTEEKNK
ncbi:MAG: alpha/beta hydrolase [Candidatus Aminicenantes bacterium]|nr:MAG: alpha/beta hydrolase [Candidatus Aminicenantes bacterium]